MGEVWFYHLERTSLDQALPELLEKTLARGWRALVRAPGRERLEALDEKLWTWRDDSFLAHGLAGEAHAERQPILLSETDEPVNGAQVLFSVGGAEVGDPTRFERCVVVFEGGDEAALAQARDQWRRVKASGAPASYWRQGSEGRWEKQA